MNGNPCLPEIYQFLTLINAIYDGKTLDYDQYVSIANIIYSNGKHDTKYEVWAESTPKHILSLKEKTFRGAYYLGIFVRYLKYGEYVFSYTDVRGIKSEINLHIYPDGTVKHEFCITGDDYSKHFFIK